MWHGISTAPVWTATQLKAENVRIDTPDTVPIRPPSGSGTAWCTMNDATSDARSSIRASPVGSWWLML